MKILKVKPYATEKSPDGGYVQVQDETGVFDAWTPRIGPLKVGENVPDGWRRKDSEKGPRLLPPDDRKGGPTAHRNTKEGQEYEQERMDRRTALMQAVAWTQPVESVTAEMTLMLANEYYNWLRKTSGAAGGVRSTRVASPTEIPGGRSAAAPDTSSEGQADPDTGKVGREPTPSTHSHEWKASPNPRMASKGWMVCDCGATRGPE